MQQHAKQRKLLYNNNNKNRKEKTIPSGSLKYKKQTIWQYFLRQLITLTNIAEL